MCGVHRHIARWRAIRLSLWGRLRGMQTLFRYVTTDAVRLSGMAAARCPSHLSRWQRVDVAVMLEWCCGFGTTLTRTTRRRTTRSVRTDTPDAKSISKGPSSGRSPLRLSKRYCTHMTTADSMQHWLMRARTASSPKANWTGGATSIRSWRSARPSSRTRGNPHAELSTRVNDQALSHLPDRPPTVRLRTSSPTMHSARATQVIDYVFATRALSCDLEHR